MTLTLLHDPVAFEGFGETAPRLQPPTKQMSRTTAASISLFKLCISANSCRNSNDEFPDTKGSDVREFVRQLVHTTEWYDAQQIGRSTR